MKIEFKDLGNIESFYSGFSEDYDSELNERTEDSGPREINLKKIDNIFFGGIDYRDYPDFCDVFVKSADMNGHPMTDEELDDLNENYNEWVHDQFTDSCNNAIYRNQF